MHTFNAQESLRNLRGQRAQTKRSSYQRSVLAKYRAELVKLRQAGASYPELVYWLKKEKRITVAHTTVMRFLQKCSELKEDNAW